MDNRSNPKISVIVPVYNAEKYLKRCVNSILAQTFTDIEVLLINDGSTDSSGLICDEYKELDNRVRVFHKENGGVSSARNVGLDNMRGEYSIHCDSDDWVEDGMLEGLYDKITNTNSDAVICDFYSDTHDDKSHRIKQKFGSRDNIINLMLTSKLHGSTWNKLYKNSLIRSNNLSFQDEVNYCEDLLFNAMFFQKAGKVAYLSRSYYHYCYNPASIVRNIDDRQFDSIIHYVEMLHKVLDSSFKEGLIEQTLRMKQKLLFSNCSYDFIRGFYGSYNHYYKSVSIHFFYKIVFFFLFKKMDKIVRLLHMLNMKRYQNIQQ